MALEPSDLIARSKQGGGMCEFTPPTLRSLVQRQREGFRAAGYPSLLSSQYGGRRWHTGVCPAVGPTPVVSKVFYRGEHGDSCSASVQKSGHRCLRELHYGGVRRGDH